MTFTGIPVPAIYRRWANIKKAYKACYSKKASGMAGMLQQLNMKVIEVTHSIFFCISRTVNLDFEKPRIMLETFFIISVHLLLFSWRDGIIVASMTVATSQGLQSKCSEMGLFSGKQDS
jgi:hypothetical protein